MACPKFRSAGIPLQRIGDDGELGEEHRLCRCGEPLGLHEGPEVESRINGVTVNPNPKEKK